MQRLWGKVCNPFFYTKIPSEMAVTQRYKHCTLFTLLAPLIPDAQSHYVGTSFILLCQSQVLSGRAQIFNYATSLTITTSMSVPRALVMAPAVLYRRHWLTKGRTNGYDLPARPQCALYKHKHKKIFKVSCKENKWASQFAFLCTTCKSQILNFHQTLTGLQRDRQLVK